MKDLEQYIAEKEEIWNMDPNDIVLEGYDAQYTVDWVQQRSGLEAKFSSKLGRKVIVGDDLTVFDEETNEELGWIEGVNRNDISETFFQGSDKWLRENSN